MYKWVTLLELTSPSRGIYFQAIRNAWWVRNEAGMLCLWVDKGRVYPQCNSDELVALTLGRRIEGFGGAIKVPLAFVPINMQDYRD